MFGVEIYWYMYYVGYSMVVVYCWFEFLVVDGV